jgi:hypothetical protein
VISTLIVDRSTSSDATVPTIEKTALSSCFAHVVNLLWVLVLGCAINSDHLCGVGLHWYAKGAGLPPTERALAKYIKHANVRAH